MALVDNLWSETFVRKHGRHLLESLGSKLAVLGPPRMVAEVPAALGDARAFFAALGWHEESPPAAPVPSDNVRFVTEARPS